MIAVIVPAHDEEQHIVDCVESLQRAARCPALLGEAVAIIVVADACSDRTEAIARESGAVTVAIACRNVGAGRAVGATIALAMGARWLAFTDADTQVTPTWLSAQLSLVSDVVCGTVAIDDWSEHGPRMRRHFELTYTDADGHRHIHGANLGVSAEAYSKAGGFQPLRSSEDVALVTALHVSGARIVWSSAPRVVTSARRRFRAPDGFGARLVQIEREDAFVGSLAVTEER